MLFRGINIIAPDFLMRKSSIIIFIFLFIGICKTYPQYNISTYNGQTISSCSGIFTSSNGCNGVNYCPNEYFTITFYSGSPDSRVSVFFGPSMASASVQAGDHLYVYDGPNVQSILMHDITTNKTNYTVPITSSGSYLTFEFISNGDQLLGFWNASISCVFIPESPESCNGNIPAANDCATSPEICNLNGYCGNTSDYYTSDLPGNFCEMCPLFLGTIQNNSWLSFTADSSFATFEISIYDCSLNYGLQFGVYSGNDCDDFRIISDPAFTSGAAGYSTANQTLTVTVPYGSAPPLIKGNKYYIMIDGMVNDDCKYTVKAKSGIFSVQAWPEQTICKGASAQIFCSSGNSYKWSPAETLDNPDIRNPIASPTITTTYSVTVTGGSPNCPQSAIASVTISVVSDFFVSAKALPEIICSGNTVILTADGASSYVWSPSVINLGSAGDTAIATPPVTTTYRVTGSKTLNSMTCKDDTSITVKVIPLPFVSLGNDSVICFGDKEILYAGSGYAAYLWNDNSKNSQLTVDSAGTYSVTVTDNNGCSANGSINMILRKPPLLDLGDTITVKSNMYSLFPAKDYASYLWNDNSRNRNLTINKTGIYSLTVTDIYNCSSYDSVYVNLLISDLIWLYNAFSPDNDGLNDIYMPEFADNFFCTDYKMTIFNRWGMKIFETDNINKGWDGTFNNIKCPAEVYVCRIRYKDFNNNMTTRLSEVVLIR